MAALSGTLKEFGIAEVLQLIGLQKKTGILTIKHDPGPFETKLHFSDGMIVNTQKFNGGEKIGGVAERLLRSLWVPKAKVEEAMKSSAESLKPVELVLLEMQVITKEKLMEASRLEIMETVFDLFHLKNGDYEFNAQFVSYDPDKSPAIATEQVMMDGFRIVDEWPIVSKQLPSMSRNYVAIDRDTSTLDEYQKRIHGLLANPRPLEDMIYLSGMGKFETMKSMSEMLQNGFISATEGEDSYGSSGSGLFAGKLGQFSVPIAYGLLVMVAALCLWIVFSNVGRHYISSMRPDGLSELGKAQNNAATARIEKALEAYRLRIGEYPGSLDILLKEGLITSSDMNIINNHHTTYNREDSQKYTLSGKTGAVEPKDAE